MKEKLGVILVGMVVLGILVVLSAANYTQKEKVPDTEANANRSTFNSGATGTQAFYTLLNETGRSVVRWQQKPDRLITAKEKDRPAVFVIIGYVRRSFLKEETDAILQWVAQGGRLVLIDRQPDDRLVKTTALWDLEARAPVTHNIFDVDPADQAAMTTDTPAISPVQPSIFTDGVNSVQPSKFAGEISFARQGDTKVIENVPAKTSGTGSGLSIPEAVEAPSDRSPTVHLASPDKNLLVDVPYGNGRIVILSDPYIVSNAGIRAVDNSRLGLNLVAADGGIVAFDEYHHGYGADSNRLLQFFAGTPVVAVFIQLLVLVAAFFFSQSRRFSRPLPDEEEDRLSKLEYIAAMAELQQKTRAYDLAIENIYSDFRRRAARSLGLDPLKAAPRQIAFGLSGAGAEAEHLEQVFFQCEEIVRGQATSKRETTRLVEELRSIEHRYNLRRRNQG